MSMNTNLIPRKGNTVLINYKYQEAVHNTLPEQPDYFKQTDSDLEFSFYILYYNNVATQQE